MHIRVLLLLIALLFFSACQNEQTIPLPKEYQPAQKNHTTKTNPVISDTGFRETTKIPRTEIKSLKSKDRKLSKNGYIKGVIQNIYYIPEKKYWIYKIKGLDTSNNKLNYAEAINGRKLAGKGDYIYAFIKNGFINSLYIYKKAQIYTFHKKKKIIKKIKIKKAIHKKTKRTPKTPHREQLITAPKAEMLTF